MPRMDIRTFLMLNARQNAGLRAETVGETLTAIDRQLIGRGFQQNIADLFGTRCQ